MAAFGITGMNMLRPGFIFPVAGVAIASFAVLTVAGANHSIWAVQALAIIAACAIAITGELWGRWRNTPLPVGLVLSITLIGIAAPMFWDKPGPARWLSLGSLSLYLAPVFLPTFLVAWSNCVDRHGMWQRMALIAIVSASVLLALQPDASQALALLIGASIFIAKASEKSRSVILALLLMAVFTAWAFARPDPLEPIAYVEGVFSLSLGYSVFLGAAVIASAAALIVSLQLKASSEGNYLSAVAAYYAALYACSVVGLTPAPLIGYGAGPWLGFGLVVGAISLGATKRHP